MGSVGRAVVVSAVGVGGRWTHGLVEVLSTLLGTLKEQVAFVHGVRSSSDLDIRERPLLASENPGRRVLPIGRDVPRGSGR